MTFFDSPQVAFDRAQAAYDRQEPPENTCCACDGCGKVEVAAIYDVDNNKWDWPGLNAPEVECPFCVDGVKQWDGDYEIQRRDSLKNLPR